ncbi:MAG: HAD-IIIA family hydrolase [Desulfatiglans sp.]|nr:HAD-IIIA family hydrolase [Thermodesulfobacteriota bacterium]MEE4351976.1 HAD-IIIA family hydrolase [Desulfatiglans sp.]
MSNLTNKLKRIKLLLLDVDGVLTDGSIIYDDNGSEIKSFNVKDGFGIRLLMSSGIEVGIVTGRASMALRHRLDNLGISLVFDGVKDKSSLLDLILKKKQVSAEEVAFVGDDLMDFQIMQKVGVSVAAKDGHAIVRDHADIVTQNRGGSGAVREVCESILKAQGLWESILEKYCS